MGKIFTYQYVCFNIRNKADIDLANKQLAELSKNGYTLYHTITENRNQGFDEIKVNTLRKEIKI